MLSKNPAVVGDLQLSCSDSQIALQLTSFQPCLHTTCVRKYECDWWLTAHSISIIRYGSIDTRLRWVILNCSLLHTTYNLMSRELQTTWLSGENITETSNPGPRIFTALLKPLQLFGQSRAQCPVPLHLHSQDGFKTHPYVLHEHY